MFSSQVMQFVQNKELRSISVEYVLGNSINVHMLRKLLEKGFSCVIMKFLYANATFYGLYHNFRILYTKETSEEE